MVMSRDRTLCLQLRACGLGHYRCLGLCCRCCQRCWARRCLSSGSCHTTGMGTQSSDSSFGCCWNSTGVKNFCCCGLRPAGLLALPALAQITSTMRRCHARGPVSQMIHCDRQCSVLAFGPQCCKFIITPVGVQAGLVQSICSSSSSGIQLKKAYGSGFCTAPVVS